jgi:tetratricopeptide (TPR) repeat protein
LKDDDEFLNLIINKEIESGQFKDAEKDFKLLLNREDESPKFLFTGAKLYYTEKLYVKALDYIEKAIEYLPENYNSMYKKTYLLAGKISLAMAEFSKAEHYFKNSLECGEDGNIYRYLGILKFTCGNYMEAEKYLKLSLKLQRGDIDT